MIKFDTDALLFELLYGSGCDFGILRRTPWKWVRKDSLTRLNVTKYQMTRSRACAIILHRSHWRPPSSAFVQCSGYWKVLPLCDYYFVIISAIGPSTVWQLPPTTFWWPVIAPRPHSSWWAFYGPCRGSPWSCPSRSPGKEGKGWVWEMLKPFPHWHQRQWQTNTADATLWGLFSTHLHYFISLL